MNYLLKNVDPDWWHRVKLLATAQKKTIKQLIIDLLNEALDRNNADADYYKKKEV